MGALCIDRNGKEKLSGKERHSIRPMKTLRSQNLKPTSCFTSGSLRGFTKVATLDDCLNCAKLLGYYLTVKRK